MDVVPRELKVFKSQRRRKAYQLDQRKNIIEVVSSGSCRTEGRIYGLIKTLELMAPPWCLENRLDKTLAMCTVNGEI